MSKIPEILVTIGPLQGKRFSVTTIGLRLGRSSSCEIAIADPALSRNHCLFELREDALWVTDLASANGTFVNDEQLGSDSFRLKRGDVVMVGESYLTIVDPGDDSAVSMPPAGASAEPAALDLGLGGGEADQAPGASSRQSLVRFLLWLVAVITVAGAAMMILFEGSADKESPVQVVKTEEKPVLHSFSFEKVEADAKGIYRYALSLDSAGVLSVDIDDVPKENRHVKKTQKLSTNALEEVCRILSSSELYALEREYSGVPLDAGTLKSFSLRVVRGSRVFSTTIENALEPEAFRTVREKLETFSKNELGIWAIQFSADKLIEMSEESRKTGDAKWEERDVQYGNLSEALSAYREAIFYLETVNPKPANYGALVARSNAVTEELERRYRDQRFVADRAINLGEWVAAQRALRVLCEIIPDVKDARHAEAAAKLLDVENRIKKGGKK